MTQLAAPPAPVEASARTRTQPTISWQRLHLRADCFGSAAVYTTHRAALSPLRWGERSSVGPAPRAGRASTSPLSTKPWTAARDSDTHLFNLEVVRPQRLLDLLLDPSRRRLHRAAEAVEHPLERELLHRESPSRRGSFVRRPLAPAATSQPSAADSEPVLAEGRSVAPALLAPLLRRAALVAADAATRPPHRRSTKTRRGTASGMYGNAAPWPIDSRDSGDRATHAHYEPEHHVVGEVAADWPERARRARSMLSPCTEKR